MTHSLRMTEERWYGRGYPATDQDRHDHFRRAIGRSILALALLAGTLIGFGIVAARWISHS